MKVSIIPLMGLLCLILMVIGCSKDSGDIKLQVSETILNYGDTYQIEAVSESTITYAVENEYHASVSDIGLISALHVGETQVNLTNAEDNKVFKLTIEPTSTLYPDPSAEYGTSKADIKAEYGVPDTETSSAILYTNYSSKAPIIIYAFDDNDKLESYAVMVKSTYSSELGTFLSERYMFLGNNDNVLSFLNGLSTETATLYIGAELYDLSYWMVGYLYIESVNKSGTLKSTEKDDIMKGLKEHLKNTLNL